MDKVSPLSLIPPAASVRQTVCHVRHVRWSPRALPCRHCGAPARRRWETTRRAIDIDLESPVLLLVTVSVHYCRPCKRFMRAQPPFLRRDAIYTNRVVTKAVQSVYSDGMAVRQVPARLARDFWVQPSEAMIRHWCRTYCASLDFVGDYQAWVVEEFSGVLCVDEVYQNTLALLVAVDPAALEGDRLVGYALVTGTVDKEAVAAFLTRLKAVGISPEQVITDGSSLYPGVLAQIWPTAAHQLCLFHETRHVTEAALAVINTVRTLLPTPPPAPPRGRGGPLRTHPPTDDRSDAATAQWHRRQATRQTAITQVQRFAAQGYSQRAIARQMGLHRKTVKCFLAQEKPCVEGTPVLLPEAEETPCPLPPPLQEETQPPAPWPSWDAVRQVREDLKQHRFLLLCRADHLTNAEDTIVAALLASPVGPRLQLAHRFVREWYAFWRDDCGARRTPDEARTRYTAWQATSAYQDIPVLRRALERVPEPHFTKLSQFLRHAHWEATNDGAERAGRGFRHEEAAHFQLRSARSVADTLTAQAVLHKARCTTPLPCPHERKARGRRPVVRKAA